MLVASVDQFVEALQESNLVRAEQIRKLETEFAAEYGKAQDFANHLIGQGWITAYQAATLLDGRGQELMLGQYVILDLLGEGGMGKVFKAKQLRLNRLVALKVIHPDLLNIELARKRFSREATTAAQLCHPNIVRLYDAVQVGNCHFLVMEYVDGINLSERVAEAGCLPVETACSYIRQVATGLQHAHDLGFVHRDIKPGNLLVTVANLATRTSGGVIKILDMGLARIAPGLEDGSALTALTQEGAVIGTPDYMPPEQAKNGSDVDSRSDLYSLGCTLFFLLTGHPPFRQGTMLEILLKHQMDPPPPIQMYRPDVPNEVVSIINILLAKRPEDRFQSALALADALEPWSVFDKTARRPTNVIVTVAPEPVTIATPNDAERLDFEAAGRTRCDRPKFNVVNIAAPRGPARTRRRRFAALSAIFLAAGLAVGGIIAGSNAVKKPVAPPAAPTQSKEQPEPQPHQEKELPLPPRTAVLEPLDAFLPVDTEFIAIINVKQLGKSKFFREKIRPKFEAQLKDLLSATTFDPLASLDLVIVAVPALSENQEIMIVQGTDFLTSDLLNWVGRLPNVQFAPASVPGQGMKDVYRLIRDKDRDEADLFGAILSINPSRVVLSPSRQRVIEALARVGHTMETKFDDPTIQPMLAHYSSKSIAEPSLSPPTLWMAIGTRAKRFEFGSSMDSGVQSIIGTIRLDDGLDFDATVEAGNRMETVTVWGKITIFAQEEMAKKPAATCLHRFASLLVQATPTRFPQVTSGQTFVGHWSVRIESKTLTEWFAPFFKNP